MRVYERYIKRVLDVFLSGLGIVVLSPIMLITAVLVRIKLGSPVVFKQKRPGKNEKIFELYKFRTMNDKKDSKGILLPDEERLTKFSRGLRATSIDETLSLINIIRGDMSIVGPRPLLTRYLPYYTDEERIRHSVRPGLTGLAQINGRNNVGWDDRLQYDVKYVKNITFIGDMKIILKTVAKVLKHSDIASGKQLIMQDLDKERAWMTMKRKNSRSDQDGS
ncbi:MAG: sugar transferase [Hungatella sp.]|nr:sugar transferase [Hungatella sp.]